MGRMLVKFKTSITSAQAMKPFEQRNDANRTWPEHFCTSWRSARWRRNARAGQHCESCVRRDRFCAEGEVRPNRSDQLRHAEEMAHFAQSIKYTATSIGQEVVAAHVNNLRLQKESRVGYGCGKTCHIRSQCRLTINSGGGVCNSVACPKSEDGEESGMFLALKKRTPRARGTRAFSKAKSKESDNALGDGKDGDRSSWILDSGSSRHLVNEAVLLLSAAVARSRWKLTTHSSSDRLKGCGFVWSSQAWRKR